ncbi:TatD family hydrolase [Alkalicella caledoniensis]|uniref:TatD family hydrolase n=2 Tax=Alkalicella caledoniensis TaxID=2731377 RepID=A0A7G9WD92_ALKCA|nr:TatD family hydrolase [Alkalicella caledoniensis]
MIDSHCHMENPKYQGNVDDLIRDCVDEGIIAMVNTGYDIPSSKQSILLSEKYEQVYATVGIHPHDAKESQQGYLNQLGDLSKNSKVVAIGEIGLDYYYDLSPRETQKMVFAQQLSLSFDLKKPFVIHQRDAMGDMLSIIDDFPNPINGGVFHCYSGSLETAKELVKKGYMLSIGGPITFKNAKKTVEVVKNIPLEYLLVETDCPYLTPEPYRGKLNYPYYVKYVIEKIAQIKGVEPEEVAAKTTTNANKFFRLGLK